ncbi:dipeptidase [bacterium]|nr:dipeptidase [bacterium]
MASKLKKIFLVLVFVLIVLYVVLVNVLHPILEKGMNKINEHKPYSIRPEVQKTHDKLTIVDWHSDSLLWARNLLKRSDYGHVDIPRLREGNVAIQMFTVVTKSPSGQNYDKNTADSDNITTLAMAQLWPYATWSSLIERALYQASKLHAFAAKAPEELRVITSKKQLKEALVIRQTSIQQQKKSLVLGLLGIEGLHALEGKLENIQVLYDAGYRMMELHHFFDNKLGGSLHGISHAGLTDFGRQVVRKLNEMSAIIDLAHSSPAVVDDVLEISTRPVVVSHTGVYGVCASVRNISDEQMKKIAANGGLIAIGYWDGAICDISPKGIIKSIRYAIDLIGEDHVALGSDFDGTTTNDIDTSELAVLTQEMLDSGFTETEIRKVMGENSVNFLLNNLPD